jgi:hypothetical protein
VRRLSRAAGVVALAVLTGCGGGSAGGSPPGAAVTGSAIVMTSPRSGYAVLPSGARWVLIATQDGWHTVTNATPTSVPTDGGLVIAASGATATLGVLPYGLLSVSPVLASSDAGRHWTAGQLPGGLAVGASLSVSTAGTAALLRNNDGEVVGATRPRGPWRPLAAASSLASGISLRSVTAGAGGQLVVTAAGPADAALLFSRAGADREWRGTGLPAPGSTSAVVAVGAPCLVARHWLVPVVRGSSLWLADSTALTGPWRHGPAIDVGSSPVVACGPTSVWVYSDDPAKTLHVAGVDGWLESASLREAVTALSVVDDGAAFATVDGAGYLVALTRTAGMSESRIPLPAWVSSVGGGAMGS